MSSSSGRYVHRGRLLHDNKPYRRFSRIRCILVVLGLGLLIVTNPGNKLLAAANQNDESPGMFAFLMAPQDTNFLIITLRKSLDGISIQGLGQTLELCNFASPDDLVVVACEWMGETLCHGKPLVDTKDLPFTATRLVVLALMTSVLLSFCAEGQPIFQRIRRNHFILDSLLSVWETPTLSDFIQVQLILFPALVTMDRLLTVHLVQGRNQHFWICVFLLLLVVGSIGNLFGSLTCRRRLHGIKTVWAASLGYHRAITQSSWSPLQFLMETSSSSILSTIFWMQASAFLVSNEVGLLCTWFAGAMMGHVIGHVHQEWLANAFGANLQATFQQAFHKFF